MDVMDMTESMQGHKYIVCARDDLSRATECRALFKNDSLSLMQFFWEQIYCRYGAIAEVVQGPDYLGEHSLPERRHAQSKGE